MNTLIIEYTKYLMNDGEITYSLLNPAGEAYHVRTQLNDLTFHEFL